MLAEQRRRTAGRAGGFGQVAPRRRKRHGSVETGIVALFEQMRGADMGVVERLLRRIDLTGDDARLFEFGVRLLAAPLGAPRRHSGRNDLAMIGTGLIAGVTRVREP